MNTFNPAETMQAPAGWNVAMRGVDGAAFASKTLGLMVVVSGDVEEDGRRWLHVSVSRRSRVPGYDDLLLVKRLFIGELRQAIQVFPPRDRHINIHPYCLHLWSCLEGDGLPDFARGGNTI